MKIILLLLMLAVSASAQTPQPTPHAEISPQSVALRVGETVQVSITAYDSTGAVVTPAVIAFEPDANIQARFPSCVKVSPMGLVTAITVNTCGVSALVRMPDGTYVVPSTPLTVAVVLNPTIFADSSGRAIALQSPLFTRAPFSLMSPLNFSADKRTRVAVFLNVDPAGTAPATIDLVDSHGTKFPLVIEYSGQIPALAGFWQVVIVLPAAAPGDATLELTTNGVVTSTAIVAIGP
jgi:uncharacterized protein (TIGR03437 family)